MSGRSIILMIIILSGCSVSRRAGETKNVYGDSSLSLLEKAVKGNVMHRNFNIPKAEIEIFNNGEKQKLLAYMKYREPGMYLISIRSRAGIEAARIYITKDTLLINDKIYKKLYCGSTEDLTGKYGISTAALPLIIGDFLYQYEGDTGLLNCKNGEAEFIGTLNQNEIRYKLDCKLAKVTDANISAGNRTVGINMKFSDFKETDNFIFPGVIQVEDFSKQNQIKIELSSINFDVSDNIEFIPGKNYEIVVLK